MANIPATQILAQIKGMGYNASQAGKILVFAQANPQLRGEIMEYAKQTLMPKRPVGGVRISTRDIHDFFQELHRSVLAGGSNSPLASVKALPRYNLNRGQNPPRQNQQQASNNQNRGRPQRQSNNGKPQRRSASVGATGSRPFVAYNQTYKANTADYMAERNKQKPASMNDTIKKYKENLAARSALKPLPPTTSEGLSQELQLMWEFRQLWEGLLPSAWAFALNDGINVELGDANEEGVIREAFIAFHYRVPIDLASQRQNTKHGAATFVRQTMAPAEGHSFVQPLVVVDKQLEDVKKMFPGAYRNENGHIVIEAEPSTPLPKKQEQSGASNSSSPKSSKTHAELHAEDDDEDKEYS